MQHSFNHGHVSANGCRSSTSRDSANDSRSLMRTSWSSLTNNSCSQNSGGSANYSHSINSELFGRAPRMTVVPPQLGFAHIARPTGSAQWNCLCMKKLLLSQLVLNLATKPEVACIKLCAPILTGTHKVRERFSEYFKKAKYFKVSNGCNKKKSSLGTHHHSSKEERVSLSHSLSI